MAPARPSGCPVGNRRGLSASPPLIGCPTRHYPLPSGFQGRGEWRGRGVEGEVDRVGPAKRAGEHRSPIFLVSGTSWSLSSMLICPRKDSNAPVNRCTCPSMASNRWLVQVVSSATLSRAWTLASRTAIRLACSTCAALKSTREKKLKKDLNKLLISLTSCEPNPLRLWLSLIAVIIHHHDIFFILIAVSDDWSRPLPLPLLLLDRRFCLSLFPLPHLHLLLFRIQPQVAYRPPHRHGFRMRLVRVVASVLASFAARACRTQLVHLAIPVPPLTSRAGLQIDLHLTGGASRLGVFHLSRSFWRSGWRGRWRNILIVIFVNLPEFLR